MWTRLFIVSCVVMLMAVESFASTEIEGGQARFRECKCANFDCGCCTHIEINHPHINGTLCSDMRYLPNDIGISLTITYNKITIYNETVSVRNPPSICPVFIEEVQIEFCIKFYNLDFDLHHIYGCAEAEISCVKLIPLMTAKLGCFHMGHKNSSNNSVPYSVVLV